MLSSSANTFRAGWGHAPTRSARSMKTQYLTVTALFALVLALSFPPSVWVNMGKLIQSTRNTLPWSIPKPERATIHIIPASVHFDLGTPAWKHLLPSGGHVIHLDQPDGSVSTHTVAMFHQLRCVEILQQAYFDEGSHRTSEITAHCLNYFRETFSCHMDMRLEPQGTVYTRNGFESQCYDWEGIFHEAEKNHQVYKKRGLE